MSFKTMPNNKLETTKAFTQRQMNIHRQCGDDIINCIMVPMDSQLDYEAAIVQSHSISKVKPGAESYLEPVSNVGMESSTRDPHADRRPPAVTDGRLVVRRQNCRRNPTQTLDKVIFTSSCSHEFEEKPSASTI